ncbi:hypothetical protein K491DRAFT_678941 [Lophiostoma macrostomum CBS 122681]|uniref:Uncharacterized protein n=1 Tax=Lophiostoma macrostomum CBS 122681 TaxID=1314788 RepID=A0A6A6T9W2_9PLEO|nr:hypothetical protein K491DRAFT_678941 [Lophiostoma macrostomum CBS 122681]
MCTMLENMLADVAKLAYESIGIFEEFRMSYTPNPFDRIPSSELGSERLDRYYNDEFYRDCANYERRHGRAGFEEAYLTWLRGSLTPNDHGHSSSSSRRETTRYRPHPPSESSSDDEFDYYGMGHDSYHMDHPTVDFSLRYSESRSYGPRPSRPPPSRPPPSRPPPSNRNSSRHMNGNSGGSRGIPVLRAGHPPSLYRNGMLHDMAPDRTEGRRSNHHAHREGHGRGSQSERPDERGHRHHHLSGPHGSHRHLAPRYHPHMPGGFNLGPEGWHLPEPYHDEMNIDTRDLQDVEVVATGRKIDITKYTKTVSDVPDDTTCGICLDGKEDGKVFVRPRKCQHLFHKDCLELWVNGTADNSEKCPTCRVPFCSEKRPRALRT